MIPCTLRKVRKLVFQRVLHDLKEYWEDPSKPHISQDHGLGPPSNNMGEDKLVRPALQGAQTRKSMGWAMLSDKFFLFLSVISIPQHSRTWSHSSQRTTFQAEAFLAPDWCGWRVAWRHPQEGRRGRPKRARKECWQPGRYATQRDGPVPQQHGAHDHKDNHGCRQAPNCKGTDSWNNWKEKTKTAKILPFHIYFNAFCVSEEECNVESKQEHCH